jgi:hypothetical protein
MSLDLSDRHRRVRLAASLRLLKGAALLSRVTSRISDLATGFAMGAIDSDDRGALTAAVYGSHRTPGRKELFAWEEAWVTRDLPAPPARVLLGGAGRGREARWLLDRGYRIVAFDPARESVVHHAAECPEAPCVVLDYESLARACPRENEAIIGSSAALVLDSAPYDAALLGWGSLTHVLDERDQDALFAALAVLVPHGPILASFFMSAVPRPSRAVRLGERLGNALGSSKIQSSGNNHVRCLPHAGFTYSFEPARLEQLARCASRKLELHSNASYPHATFR